MSFLQLAFEASCVLPVHCSASDRPRRSRDVHDGYSSLLKHLLAAAVDPVLASAYMFTVYSGAQLLCKGDPHILFDSK